MCNVRVSRWNRTTVGFDGVYFWEGFINKLMDGWILLEGESNQPRTGDECVPPWVKDVPLKRYTTVKKILLFVNNESFINLKLILFLRTISNVFIDRIL